MPRLSHFLIRIETGQHGLASNPLFNINGHTLPLTRIDGGVGPGETFEGGYAPQSFVHRLTLVGPESGPWEIRRMTVTYETADGEPYTVVLGAVTLDATNEVNIWRDRPAGIFDV